MTKASLEEGNRIQKEIGVIKAFIQKLKHDKRSCGTDVSIGQNDYYNQRVDFHLTCDFIERMIKMSEEYLSDLERELFMLDSNMSEEDMDRSKYLLPFDGPEVKESEDSGCLAGVAKWIKSVFNIKLV